MNQTVDLVLTKSGMPARQGLIESCRTATDYGAIPNTYLIGYMCYNNIRYIDV